MTEYHVKLSELKSQGSFRGQQWFGKRQELVEKYGWAVPNRDVVSYISNFNRPITEVGAGKAYWASLIEERGTPVEAFDVDPPDDPYIGVQQADAADLGGYIEGSPLMLVWPPVNNYMAAMCVSHEPSHVLYVGEERGGCTASDEFFNVLDERYGLVKEIDIPSFEGVNDNFYHYVRKR